MAEHVSGEITVDAPLTRVHEVVIRVEDYPQWADGVRSVEVLARDDEGLPERAKFEIDTPMGRVGYTLAYTHGDDEVRWHLVEGELLKQLDGMYALTADGESTRVRCALDVGVDLPLPGALTRQVASSILERGLEGVKARAESAED